MDLHRIHRRNRSLYNRSWSIVFPIHSIGFSLLSTLASLKYAMKQLWWRVQHKQMSKRVSELMILGGTHTDHTILPQILTSELEKDSRASLLDWWYLLSVDTMSFLLEYWYIFFWLYIIRAISQLHRMDSSIAFFIRPHLRLLNVTCTISEYCIWTHKPTTPLPCNTAYLSILGILDPLNGNLFATHYAPQKTTK